MNGFSIELFETKADEICEALETIEQLEKEIDLKVLLLQESLPNYLRQDKGRIYIDNSPVATPYQWLEYLKYDNLKSLRWSINMMKSEWERHINTDFRDFRRKIEQYNKYKKGN